MGAKWEKGRPNDSGLFVCEWTNMGGYAVFQVVNRDGVLFARDTETDRGQRETRLDKWAISQHLRIPSPFRQRMSETFGVDIESANDRQEPSGDRSASLTEQSAAGELID